jgi:hypothetical protein
VPIPAVSTGRPALRIALWALMFRVFSAGVAFLSNVVFPDNRVQEWSVLGTGNAFWDAFARWDSGWYFQIARYGFHYTPGGRDTIAWFPVYPLLMRYVGRLFGRSPADVYFGGIVVSWAAFVLAMVGLYQLACLDLPRRRAERAVLLATVFPFAYFFGAVYSESVFLAAVVGAFYLFRTKRWIIGGLCGAIATATRVNGLMMLPALAWIAWRTSNGGGRRDRVAALCGVLLVPCGVALDSAYVYSLSGNPLEWASAIERWDYHPGGIPFLAPLTLLGHLVSSPYRFLTQGPMAPYDMLNGLAAVGFVAAVPFVWARYGAGYGLYMAANLWLPLSSGLFEGLGRYCSVLFPFFIWLAGIRSRRVFLAAVVASAMLYTLCLALFANVHPLF